MTVHSAHDERRKLVHVARIPVRWRDMDLNRHVNNVVYFRYLEQARIEWFDLAVNVAGLISAGAFVGFSYEAEQRG